MFWAIVFAYEQGYGFYANSIVLLFCSLRSFLSLQGMLLAIWTEHTDNEAPARTQNVSTNLAEISKSGMIKRRKDKWKQHDCNILLWRWYLIRGIILVLFLCLCMYGWVGAIYRPCEYPNNQAHWKDISAKIPTEINLFVLIYGFSKMLSICFASMHIQRKYKRQYLWKIDCCYVGFSYIA